MSFAQEGCGVAVEAIAVEFNRPWSSKGVGFDSELWVATLQFSQPPGDDDFGV
jgi:hypothetical protein